MRAERGSADLAGEIHVRGALVCDGPVVVEAGDVLEEQPTWGVLTDRAPKAKANGDLVVRLDLETARPAGAANDYTDAFVLRFGDEPDVWPVESFKHSNGKLTLAGAAGAPGAVPGAAWTLTSAKGRRTVFHGPVVARTVTVEPPPAWADLDKHYWESAHKIWRDGGKSGEFSEFLARPSNWPAIFEATWGKGAAPLPGTIWHTGLSPVPTVLFTHRPEAGGPGGDRVRPAAVRPGPGGRRRRRRAAVGGAGLGGRRPRGGTPPRAAWVRRGLTATRPPDPPRRSPPPAPPPCTAAAPPTPAEPPAPPAGGRRWWRC